MPHSAPITNYPAAASPVARALTIAHPVLIAVANGGEARPSTIQLALADAMVRYAEAGLALPESFQAAWAMLVRRLTGRDEQLNVEVAREVARDICRAAELPEADGHFRALGPDMPLFFRSFDDYVATFPEGEPYRRWLTHGGRANAYVIRGWGQHRGIPGGYVWASIGWNGQGVFVNDCDDGLMRRACADAAEAQRILDELCELAPFTFGDLTAFGFSYE